MYPYAVIDLHCDTLTSCLLETPIEDTLNDPRSALALSRLPRNPHWAQCFAIFVDDELDTSASMAFYDQYQASFTHQMAKFSHLASPCRTAADIEAAWEAGKTAAILTVENGSALGGQLSRVDQMARDGVKILTLTWNGANEIGSGVKATGGLTAFGRAVIPRMEELGITLDVSHLNDETFWAVLDRASLPFVATHSNARSICSHPRNLTDDQIRAMVERDCLIGLNYADYFLRDECNATFDDLRRHIDHFLDLGAETCLALGSDYDGADIPDWLDTPEKEADLYGRLLKSGYPDSFCDKLMYQNALSFFRSNWI